MVRRIWRLSSSSAGLHVTPGYVKICHSYQALNFPRFLNVKNLSKNQIAAELYLEVWDGFDVWSFCIMLASSIVLTLGAVASLLRGVATIHFFLSFCFWYTRNIYSYIIMDFTGNSPGTEQTRTPPLLFLHSVPVACPTNHHKSTLQQNHRNSMLPTIGLCLDVSEYLLGYVGLGHRATNKCMFDRLMVPRHLGAQAGMFPDLCLHGVTCSQRRFFAGSLYRCRLERFVQQYGL